MDKLPSMVQKGGESVQKYIERFLNLSLMYLAGMPLPMLLQTCRHNFFDRVKVRTGAVKAHTWKEIIKQAEIAEKSLRSLSPQCPRTNGGSIARDETQLNPIRLRGIKLWQLSYLGKLH